MKKYLLLVVVLLQLGACSRVQLFYHQLDWLLPLYLENYFVFNDQQQKFVDQQVESLLQWHCSSQLKDYAALLRQANKDIQARGMSRERLLHYSDRIEVLWAAILHELTPAMSALLRTMSDAQVRELLESFREGNAEAREEFTGISIDELKEQQVTAMTGHLETWFRVLNRRQKQALHRWGEQFQPMGKQGLAMRRRWQAALNQALRHRQADSFQAEITRLFSRPRELYPDAYRQQLDDNWALTIEMIHAVISRMDSEQFEYLARAVESYAKDFEVLACAGPGIRPAS